MARSVRGSLSRVVTCVAPGGLARWDHRRHAGRWKPPLNGQSGRQAAVEALLFELDVSLVVETGTYTGSSTLWFAARAPRVVSIELDERYHRMASERIRRTNLSSRIDLRLGDSRATIDHLAATSDATDSMPLFYLDAHWNDDLPLRGELALIAEHWSSYVIVIDDFRVDVDAGYGFDDYGPGRALTIELLRTWSRFAAHVAWWPSLASSAETGGRRGWIVIAPFGSIANTIDRLSLLCRASGYVG